MAKESMKAREVKRQRMVDKYAEKKAALKKAALADAEGNIDYDALAKLQKLPKNASKVRLHNRCVITAVQKDTCVSSASPEFSSARWQAQDSFPE